MQSGVRQLIHTLALVFTLACTAFSAQAEPQLQLTANLVWQRDEPWFGGFSAVEVSAKGQRALLLTDKSNLLHVEMLRTEGRLTGLRLQERQPLRHANNRIIKDRHSDSEGLAIGRNGAVYLSFENATRVVELFVETGATRRLPDHPAFERLEINKGLEALAIHPNGTLFTLPERIPASSNGFPLFAFRKGSWRISHYIPRRGPFMAVGADFDAAGRLYLLERALTPLGFRSRIRRFTLDAANLTETTLLTSNPGRFDNLEGLSVWRDAAGQTRLTLISDDNFLAIQRTQIVEFTVIE